MEPPAVPADVERRPTRPARPSSVNDLIALQAPNVRSAFACAGLAAALVGATGAEAGLLWLVAGVWAVRTSAQTPLGLPWGVACLGAGMRWGTLGLGDVEVATRLAGPTLLAGPLSVRIGMSAALLAAIVGESHVDGFTARTWGERAAAAAAVASLAPLFVVQGPTDPGDLNTVWWVLTSTGVTALVLLGRTLATRIPGWAPSAVAVGGAAAAVMGS